MITEVDKTVSYCGYSDLLAKILDRDRGDTRGHFGLPLAYPKCMVCGGDLRTKKQKKSGICSRGCFHLFHTVPISCSECGVIFFRKQSQLIFRFSRRRQKLYFCSNTCKGRFAGKNYSKGHPKKWDYEKIEELAMNGKRPKIIGELLGIPNPSIYNILCRLRKTNPNIPRYTTYRITK